MITAILQARMSSTRLPGKVLRPILGKPMLALQLERISRSKRLDRIVIATTDQPDDDKIEEFARDSGIECYRGSLDDVLDRYYRAVRFIGGGEGDQIVRLTGDCPLTDVDIIDQLIDLHIIGGYDYSSNVVQLSYPDGLDVEAMTYNALEIAWREADLPSQREHVTFFLVEQPERFNIGSLSNEQDLSHHRWTVDVPNDFELISRIYQALYPGRPDFTTAEVLTLLERYPEWVMLNQTVERNSGWQSAFKKDRDWLANEGNYQ